MTGRRAWLKSAGAAAVYQLGARAQNPSVGPVPGANGSLGVGFIGVGIRGSQLMGDFAQISGVRFVAIADLYDGYLAHAKEFTEGKAETTKHYEDILSRKDIDAVVIAVPDHLHKKLTLDALAAGKHVYIEKPLTWGLSEGPQIIAAEKNSGKVLMVGSGGKTTAMAQKVKELLAEQAVGKVTLVRMANNRNSKEGAWIYPIPPDASPETIEWARFLGSAPKRDFSPEVFFRWRCWWEYSGGVATDLFVHMLTTLHEVTGAQAPQSVVSQGGLWFWKDGRTVPDVLESVFAYPEGFLAQLCVNLKNSAPSPQMVVYGSEGTLVWDRGKIMVTPEPEDRDIQQYGTLAWPKAARELYLKQRGWDPAAIRQRPQPKEVTVQAGPSHAEFFVTSIREGTPSRENATEGHAAAGGAHIANLAYRKGAKVSWDFATNRVKVG